LTLRPFGEDAVVNVESEAPGPATASSESADVLHVAWRKNRDAALAEFFASFKETPDWRSLATRPGPDQGSGDNRLSIGFATIAAACVNAHEAAAEGYFALAALLQVGDEVVPAAWLYYARSLDHAQAVKADFAAARAAYCLGRIDADRGFHDSARNHFIAARDHADAAANPDGKAAALYRLALLAMEASDLKAASDNAIESYIISRKAGQLWPAAETMTALFAFYSRLSFDDLAIEPAVDLLSAVVQALSGGDDVERTCNAAALALRAIAPLSAAARESILEILSERFGVQIGNHIRHEVDTIVASLEQPK
jgi:hypothetical protein